MLMDEERAESILQHAQQEQAALELRAHWRRTLLVTVTVGLLLAWAITAAIGH